ncbi:hypothetical protein BH23CHL2_BH23CHL2_12700 [soil metagenome]
MRSLLDIVQSNPCPEPWSEVSKIPWDDPDFSRRMLDEHLSQDHDAASRRLEMVDRHVTWIDDHILEHRPARILDLGCGPGLYLHRLADLGHGCTGIDFGPASIAYAREIAGQRQLDCTFNLGDLRATAFPEDQDLVMLIFGELNVFKREDALDILTRSRQSLREGGSILLEVHTHGAVRRMGEESPTWRAAERGLFSDRPHIRLDDACWHEKPQVAVERHIVIDAGSGEVALFGASVQAYSQSDYEELLREAGFELLEWRDDWPGLERANEFRLLLGKTA